MVSHRIYCDRRVAVIKHVGAGLLHGAWFQYVIEITNGATDRRG